MPLFLIMLTCRKTLKTTLSNLNLKEASMYEKQKKCNNTAE